MRPLDLVTRIVGDRQKAKEVFAAIRDEFAVNFVREAETAIDCVDEDDVLAAFDRTTAP